MNRNLHNNVIVYIYVNICRYECPALGLYSILTTLHGYMVKFFVIFET